MNVTLLSTSQENMDYEKFRRSGELSDITVIVDKIEYKLHKFPLFTKSGYFKKAIESTSAPYVIRLDNNFPGGAEIFSQLADYLYSIPISPAINRAVSPSISSLSKLNEANPPPAPAYQLKLPSKVQTHWYKPTIRYAL